MSQSEIGLKLVIWTSSFQVFAPCLLLLLLLLLLVVHHIDKPDVHYLGARILVDVADAGGVTDPDRLLEHHRIHLAYGRRARGIMFLSWAGRARVILIAERHLASGQASGLAGAALHCVSSLQSLFPVR